MATLSSEQLSQFEKDGYLQIPGFVEPGTTKALLERARNLLKDFDVNSHPKTIFAGSQNKKHVGDDYFLESGDKIRFFLEPDALNDKGELVKPKEFSVNKIGHGLHMKDDVYAPFTMENERIKGAVKDLGVHKDPRVIQSMVICKPPEIGSAVVSHDDSTFLYTNPLSAIGFWIALEDCDMTNGCLSFVPGSHRRNPIRKRLVRQEGSTGTHMVNLSPEEIQEPELGVPPDWDREGNWVPAPCKAGDLVLLHGSVVHRSERNLSDRSRFIYTFHLIDGEAEWDEKNWLQPTPESPFSKLAV